MFEEWQEFLKWTVSAHIGLWIGVLVMLVLLSIMLRQKRSPAASAAWLVFMLAVPYVGVPLYLAIGARKLQFLIKEKRRLFVGRNSNASFEFPIQHLLSQLGIPDTAEAAKFQLHHSAQEASNSLWQMLEQAEHSVDIEIFILAGDESGTQLIERIIQCATRGIKVRLLLDAVGSFLLSHRRLRPLIEAGGQVAWFVPVMHIPLRGRTNLRNHRKLIIVDGYKVWSGGRNLNDECLLEEAQSHWYDLSFDLTGPVADNFHAIFEADWLFAKGSSQAPVYKNPLPLERQGPTHLIQVIPSGPDMSEDVIEHALVELIRGARQHIILITPYYVPSESLQNLLCVTARSGVIVELLLPLRSNHRFADYVRNRFLRELHAAGVSIRVLPNDMLHAKAMTIDDRHALLGSANIDLRSLYLNFELSTLLYNRADVLAVQQWATNCIEKSKAWQPPARSAIKETLEGLVMLLAFQL